MCRYKHAHDPAVDANLHDTRVCCSWDRAPPAPDKLVQLNKLPPDSTDNNLPSSTSNTEHNYANQQIIQISHEAGDDYDLVKGKDECQPQSGKETDATLFDDVEYNTLKPRDFPANAHAQINPRRTPVGSNESKTVGSEDTEKGGQHEYGVLERDSHNNPQIFHDDNVYSTMEEGASTSRCAPQAEFSEDVLQSDVPKSLSVKSGLQKDANGSDQRETDPKFYSYPDPAKTGEQGTGVDSDNSGEALYSNLMCPGGRTEDNNFKQPQEADGNLEDDDYEDASSKMRKGGHVSAMVSEQRDNQRTTDSYNHEPIYSEEVYGDL